MKMPLVASLLMLAGCSALPALQAPDVPAALRPPSGHVLFLEAAGTGVQVYECAEKAGRFEWSQRGAEADLADRDGRPVGRHYYPGPTWEATDGSKVVTEVKARVPDPRSVGVPWLLLARKSAAGEGLFAETASIQRVATRGGLAPLEPCGAAQSGRTVRVPYAATFYFYRAAPSQAAADRRGMAACATSIPLAEMDPACAMVLWRIAAQNLARLPEPLAAERFAEGAAAIAVAKALGGRSERECELIDAVAQFYHLPDARTHDMRLVHFERALSRARRAHPDDPEIAAWHQRASMAAFARATERAEAAYYRIARP